jgi:hypothetical protein
VSTRRPLTIVVSGMICADPHQGGATWAVLQYLLGLRALGHRVYFLEPIPFDRLQPSGCRLGDSDNAAYFRQVMSDFDFDDSSAAFIADTRAIIGLTYEDLVEIASHADLLINISGMLTDPNLLERIPVRAYLDLDPAFIQIWHSQGIDMRLEGHTHFVTIGRSIGDVDCPVPTCGIGWIKTWQPISLAEWPFADQVEYDGLTTIGNWRGYGSVAYRGQIYGQKVHSMRQYMHLPQMTSARFMTAFSIDRGEAVDLAALAENGWTLLDPAIVAATPHLYREFIQSSQAEFGIAKSGYVESHCGWFSDRSVCYLASGRPVIAQDTGFSRHLPTGAGLFSFENPSDVVAAIQAMTGDYSYHRRAARELAEKYFDSSIVLRGLLENLGF